MMPFSSALLKHLCRFKPPSTLWGFHVDPNKEFLAIVHINLAEGALYIDKSLLIKTVGSSLKVEATVNDDYIDFGNFEVNNFTVKDLADITRCLETAKICPNNANANCLKHIFTEASFCEMCVFNDKKIKKDVKTVKKSQIEQFQLLQPVVKLQKLDEIENLVRDHKKKIEKYPSESYVCPTCGEIFHLRSNLDIHLLIHLPELESTFKCHLCPKTFNCSDTLNAHLNSHTNAKKEKATVSQQPSEDASQLEKLDPMVVEESNLKSQEKVFSILKKEINPPEENQSFEKKFEVFSKLETHIDQSDAPYKCQLCPKAFCTVSGLQNHQDSHAEVETVKTEKSEELDPVGENNVEGSEAEGVTLKKKRKRHPPGEYICPTCGKKFTHHSRLKTHSVIHLPESERPYKCDLCSKAYCTSTSLQVHQLWHAGIKGFECRQCGKTYGSAGSLKSHQDTSHAKIIKHSCNVCGSTFLYYHMLKSHMKKHSGERPFKCELCNRNFSKKHILRDHMSVHARGGRGAYVCEQCGASFVYQHTKNRHLRSGCIGKI